MSIQLPHDRPSIELLTVANHVEAVNNLLYISGGGWTDHHRMIQGDAIPSSHLGIAISVYIPWNDTTWQHHLVVDIENDDSTVQVAHIEAGVNVGRPPQLPPGSDQHAVLALNADIVFPAAGGYRVVGRLDGDADVRRWAFRVHDTQIALAAAG